MYFQWDLVCGKGWLVELSMTISHVGAAFGSIIFTQMSDLYGRKPIFIACIWSNVVIAFVQAFSPSYAFYTVFNFLDGFFQQVKQEEMSLKILSNLSYSNEVVRLLASSMIVEVLLFAHLYCHVN